ncbi:unnamed protein product [Nezara viridula]|uniref:Uncharacterized protein n=1 Tax=Nezara viridula TaxID=85310 RepID=A0A9P0H9Q8_NEZVI|nr:unnamed protein product [Nezara viridula]
MTPHRERPVRGGGGRHDRGTRREGSGGGEGIYRSGGRRVPHSALVTQQGHVSSVSNSDDVCRRQASISLVSWCQAERSHRRELSPYQVRTLRQDDRLSRQHLRSPVQEEDQLRVYRDAARERGEAKRQGEEQGETSEQRIRYPQEPYTAFGSGGFGRYEYRQGGLQEVVQSGNPQDGRGVHPIPPGLAGRFQFAAPLNLLLPQRTRLPRVFARTHVPRRRGAAGLHLVVATGSVTFGYLSIYLGPPLEWGPDNGAGLEPRPRVQKTKGEQNLVTKKSVRTTPRGLGGVAERKKKKKLRGLNPDDPVYRGNEENG